MDRATYHIHARPGDDAGSWEVGLACNGRLIKTWRGESLDALLHCARTRVGTCEVLRTMDMGAGRDGDA